MDRLYEIVQKEVYERWYEDSEDEESDEEDYFM
jgi:hypothetical protein